MKDQQLKIKTLKTRLAYVLSYLGIDDIELESTNETANTSSGLSDQSKNTRGNEGRLG